MYGVSRDSLTSHQKFANRYALEVPLLSDEDGSICQAYDVLKEKNMYGRKVLGIERTTYVISPEGRIVAAFPKVKVDGHVEEVLGAVKSTVE